MEIIGSVYSAGASQKKFSEILPAVASHWLFHLVLSYC